MCIGDERSQIFRFIVYGVILSKESMVPNKLKRHIEQNLSRVRKNISNFLCVYFHQKKSLTFMEKHLKISYRFFLFFYFWVHSKTKTTYHRRRTCKEFVDISRLVKKFSFLV